MKFNLSEICFGVALAFPLGCAPAADVPAQSAIIFVQDPAVFHQRQAELEKLKGSVDGCNEGLDSLISEASRIAKMKINSKCWFAQNLNKKTDKSVCYENDETNCAEYGSLYLWNDAQNACPEGTFLPS